MKYVLESTDEGFRLSALRDTGTEVHTLYEPGDFGPIQLAYDLADRIYHQELARETE